MAAVEPVSCVPHNKAELLEKLKVLESEWKSAANTQALIQVNHSLGLLYRIEGQLEQAEPHYQAALRLSAEQHGDKHLDTATQRNYLAGLYFAAERYEEAEMLLRHSLQVYEDTLGPDDPVVAATHFALALVTRRADTAWLKKAPVGNLDVAPVFPSVAKGHLERARKLAGIDIKQLSMDRLHDLSLALMHLSHESFSQGRFEEAEELFRHSLLMELEEIWTKHPLIADSYQLLGDLCRSFGTPSQAEVLYRRALEIRRESYGEQDSRVAATAHALGVLLADGGRFSDGKPFLELACAIRRQFAFPPVLASSLRAYAGVLRALKLSSEAEHVEREADEIFDQYRSQI